MLNMRSGRKTLATIALSLVATLAPCAIALNRSLDVSQYAHTAWKGSEGFSPGVISSIAQTRDGYLWLGTEFGLRRFDGMRSVPWQAPMGEHLPNVSIGSLQAARDGRLWIGTLTGLASWKDGKLTHYPELGGYGAFRTPPNDELIVATPDLRRAEPIGRVCGARFGRGNHRGARAAL